ncbi:exodeoxyribonuclease V subunit gamma [Buchnera aphidicola]|uniref:exodeoxyribonuclease V subunit gamma n=1 Tax=Buchnera aphidicola TaxID=9 RepID=UPI0024E20B75|nr:exodeoxyribonuclease V subunit gamma [Buchnera aphidicola]
MFKVYKSNSLNILLLKAHDIIQKQPLSNIFEKEIFIYDNKVLFQYLNIFLAEKVGISANFKLYHPKDFIWKLFQIILSKKELKNTFTHSIMIWKIMNILDKRKFFENYNKKKDKIQNFKFSFLMANIFEKYIFYRPNWINDWEKKNQSTINPSEQWQIKLWMEIIDNTKKLNQCTHHFSNLFYDLQKLIKEKKIKKTHLPNRCFIISSFSLNPSYIKIFKKISIYMNIYFLYITPYKNNTFNLIQTNKIDSYEKIEKKNTLSNSLITLWGQYEKIYSLYIIESQEIKIINYFKKNKNSNLLNNIKNDFFQSSKLRKKRFLKATDNSVSINICFDKKNEIEILYEKLLIFFHENSSIEPGDIVVTSFLLDDYISHINAIFTSVDKKKQIPFFISKKFSKKTEITLSYFKKILNLSNSRFENEEILELLDVPEIAKKFNFSEEEIKILYAWIEEANIRWAVDCKHKDYLSFPKNKQNTWFYGIEKLLLSYAMNDKETIWNNILSCSVINGSRAELIGKLIIFINTLKKWQKKLSKSQHLTYWYSLSEKLISDFFFCSKKIEKPIQMIQKNWMKMINDSLISNYSQKISINILKKNFFYKYYYTNNEIFLPGVVNFCHPASVCYIPFKIICIIGADHSSIPKTNYLDNFNLLKKYPLIGDIDVYQKYCYLFAQSISCAEKYFYISYIGYSVKDKSKRYPSVLIDQLLNYIACNFCFIGDQNLSLEDNTKKIIKHLCKKYKTQYFYKKKHVISFKQENSQKIFKSINKNFHHQYLLKDKNYNIINLKDLTNFWKNPIRYFFNFNLKIQLNKKKRIIKTTEPFLVNQLDSFKIKHTLLNKIINNQDTEQLFQYYMLSGKLPYHFFGKIFWNKNIKEMTLIAKKVIKHRISKKEKKFNLNIEKYQINGILSEIQNTGLLRWKPSTINYSDRIVLWLEHLIYSVLGGCGKSRIIGYRNQTWSFSSLNSDIAYTYLLQYIKGYIKGMQQPILLTKSAASWLDHVYDIRNHSIKNDYYTQRTGYKKLLETWIGNNYIEGEQKDFYITKIITKLNTNNIKEICEIAEKWLIPILKNKLKK